jgi:hypothetical protein
MRFGHQRAAENGATFATANVGRLTAENTMARTRRLDVGERRGDVGSLSCPVKLAPIWIIRAGD